MKVCKSDAMSLRPAPRADVQSRSRLEHVLVVGIASGIDGTTHTPTETSEDAFEDGGSFTVNHLTGWMNDPRDRFSRTDSIGVDGIKDPEVLNSVISSFKRQLENWNFEGVRMHDTLPNKLWFKNDAATKEKRTEKGEVIGELEVAEFLAKSTSMVGGIISEYEYDVVLLEVKSVGRTPLTLHNRRGKKRFVTIDKKRLVYKVEARWHWR